MRYIEKINAQENGELVALGQHWPIKIYTQPTEETKETEQPELKKKDPDHSEETSSLSATTLVPTTRLESADTLKPGFRYLKKNLSGLCPQTSQNYEIQGCPLFEIFCERVS